MDAYSLCTSTHSGIRHGPLANILPENRPQSYITASTAAMNAKIEEQLNGGTVVKARVPDDDEELELLEHWPVRAHTPQRYKSVRTVRTASPSAHFASFESFSSAGSFSTASGTSEDTPAPLLGKATAGRSMFGNSTTSTFITQKKSVYFDKHQLDASPTTTDKGEDMLAEFHKKRSAIFNELAPNLEHEIASIRDINPTGGRHLTRTKSIGMMEGSLTHSASKHYLYAKRHGTTYKVAKGLTASRRLMEIVEDDLDNLLTEEEEQQAVIRKGMNIIKDRKKKFTETMTKLEQNARKRRSNPTPAQRQINAENRRNQMALDRHVSNFWDAYRVEIEDRIRERNDIKQQRIWRAHMWIALSTNIAYVLHLGRMLQLVRDAEKSEYSFMQLEKMTGRKLLQNMRARFRRKHVSKAWRKLRKILVLMRLWREVQNRRQAADLVKLILSDRATWFCVQMRKFNAAILRVQRFVRGRLRRKRTQLCLLVLQFDEMENMMVKEERQKVQEKVVTAFRGAKEDKDKVPPTPSALDRTTSLQDEFLKSPSPSSVPPSPAAYLGSPVGMAPWPSTPSLGGTGSTANSPHVSPTNARSLLRISVGAPPSPMKVERSPPSTPLTPSPVPLPTSPASHSRFKGTQPIPIPKKNGTVLLGTPKLRIGMRRRSAFNEKQSTQQTIDESQALYPPQPATYSSQFNPKHFKCPYFQLKYEVLLDDFHSRSRAFNQTLHKYFRQLEIYHSKLQHFKQFQQGRQAVSDLIEKLDPPVKPTFELMVTPLHMHALVERAWKKRDELEEAWRQEAQMETAVIEQCAQKFNTSVDQWLTASTKMKREFFSSFLFGGFL
eukprot:TRINITY_DN61505_c0_g2_i1.p1 TRINITY_DN61505_c0_g2~~TRINITY_DN61505_c0_g2_i1.p1  ORF type:complete len:836 (-),score=60.27 TRINITY_DN61505_c0_g2_i1:64-2571(-)